MVETVADPDGGSGFIRVVVGIDGSRGARQALQHAVERFGENASLTVVNVINPDAYAPERRAQKRLLGKTTQQLTQAGLDAEVLAREGSPAEILVEVAKSTSASYLVVGSRGAYVYVAGRADEDELGSVCREVLDLATCEVLVVREQVGG